MKTQVIFVLFITMLAKCVSASGAMIWNSENQFQGWKALRNVKCEVSSELLVLTEIAADPQIVINHLVIDPGKFNRFSFRYRAENVDGKGGQLYYAHSNGIFSARKMWSIPRLQGDGEWHTVTLTSKNILQPVSWLEGGMITGLRFDPTDSAGGKIEISEIRLFFEADKEPEAKVPNNMPAKKSQPLPVVEFVLDEAEWPAVQPEFKEHLISTKEELYFQGKMIKSPKDKTVRDRPDKSLTKHFYLRKEFSLKSKPVQGWLQYTADDGAVAYVNGKEVSFNNNWRIREITEVSAELHATQNVLAFRYHNNFSAGGVLAELFVKYADGSFERINTDGTFRSSIEENEGWNLPGFNDTSWEAAVEQAPPPNPPWVVKMDYFDFSNPQEFIKGEIFPVDAEAGKTVKLRFDFAGGLPEAPFSVTLTLLKNDILFWEEDLPIDQRHIRANGENRWIVEFEYLLPLYLSSANVTLRLKSGAIFCKSGGFPEVKFRYRGIKQAPGYETKTSSKMLKTAYGPTFHLNGQPFFLSWGGATQTKRPDRSFRFGDAPLNVRTVYCGAQDWYPETGKFVPEAFDLKAEAFRRDNKDAYFMWDLSLYLPPDWGEKYPDEICIDDHGEINRDGHLNYSFASKLALQDLEKMLIQAITYLEKTPYANRIIGYRVNGGHTIEWLGWDPKPERILDFSPAAENGFREFAQKHYPELKDFSIPSLAARRELDNGELLWDTVRHTNVIAYHDFYSNAVADMAIHLCRKAKKLLKNKKVVGTYYGYTFTLHGSGRSQMRAHYALKKMLDSKAVDFLMSPQAYSIRNIGGTCGDMKPFKSMFDNNILPVIEDDSRTHNGPYEVRSNQYQTLTEKATIAVMRRNMGIALCRNQPTYFYAICYGTEFDFPAMAEDIASMRKAGEFCLQNQVQRNAEIALVVSEETIKSMPMLRQAEATGMVQVYQQDGSVKKVRSGGIALTGESFIGNATRYARLGAPVDYLLAEDLHDHPGDYKLYVFINCFSYDQNFLQAIEQLRKRDCILFWIYAPGYTFNRANSVDNMRRLTGITLQKVADPILPAVQLSDGRWLGTRTLRIAPMFHAPDQPGLEKLGSYENELNGLVALRTGKALSMFCGAYQFDVPFLTELAKRAGVHIYSENSDPMEANASLFTLHARFPGVKTVRLPRKTDILDVMNKKIVARNTDQFSFDAPLHSSWIFYYGSDAENLLKNLMEK